MTDKTFEQIFKEFSPKLKVMFSKQIRDEQIVEELVQDTMLKVHTNLHSFDSSIAALSTWLYTIARNVMINHFKSNSRHPQLTSRDTFHDIEHYDSPENILIAEQTTALINKASSSINPAFLEVFTLKDFDGLSHKQIADKLDVPLSTVRSRHKRAKDTLKSNLTDV